MSTEAESERAERHIEPPGARLKAARESAGLGVQDVAAELRLGSDVIDALEHDAEERLPAPIFVRGYLRNYAGLVGLPAQELVDAYNQSTGRGQSQGPMAGPMQQQLVGARRGNYLVWLVVLALAVAAGWWFQQRSAQTPESATPASVAETGDGPAGQDQTASDMTGMPAPEEADSQSPAQEPQLAALPPQAEPVTPPPEDTAPAAEAPPPESAPPSQSVPEAAPATASAPSPQATAGDTLTLSFDQRSWVEVRDARGERLLYRLADAGESRTVQGEAPFRLVLGNAPAVRVQLNGTPVDVAAHTSGRTARFSVAP